MLKKIYILEIEIELLSGLFIGGNDNGFDIGGADSNVIKNPITKEPYIPGSSFKGKLKSLLKCLKGNVDEEKDDLILNDEDIIRIFEPLTNKDGSVNISRAIFRDLKITDESKKELKQILGEGVYTEIKAENKINLLKGTADTPRFIERVPAGVKFNGEIVLNVFDGDNEMKMKDSIKEALKLLEFNYLGGSGTRGYGRVKVKYNDFKEVDI